MSDAAVPSGKIFNESSMFSSSLGRSFGSPPPLLHPGKTITKTNNKTVNNGINIFSL